MSRADAGDGTPFPVQSSGDPGHRSPFRVLGEDPNDDPSGDFYDVDLAAELATATVGLRSGAITVRDATSREPRERSTFHSSQRLVAQVIEVEVRDKALDRVRQLRVLRARVDPSATLINGTRAYWSRLKIAAASAKSREMREMSSVMIALTVPASTAAISASKPGLMRLAPDTA